jgi:alpha-tubulin suppressor-like RCC1 family protein
MAICLVVVFVMSMVGAASAAASGTLMAWGENRYGQLGDSPAIESDVPVAVSALSGVTAVSAGTAHSLALLSNGTVMAWGNNSRGQLGDGTTTESGVPVAVSGLSGVTAVSAGNDYSLALLKNGTVMAWGQNEEGVLGDGTTTKSDVPVAVSGLSEVTAISASTFSLALLKNGTVMAWGPSGDGELGGGTRTGPESCGGFACSMTPVAVCAAGETAPCTHDLSEVTAVSGDGDHSLALLKNGTVMAWGFNQYGQLGDGPNSGPEPCGGGIGCSDVPVAVSGLSGATAVSAGFLHSLALLSNGTVMAWGYNGTGELGDGTISRESTVPVAVSGLSGATAVSAGYFHSVALLSNSTLMAWGENQYGQLGNGTNTGPETCQEGKPCSDVPVAVSGLSGVTAVSGGAYDSFALLPTEYGTCVKTTKVNKHYTGRYENKNCTNENAKSEGKYEWMPTPEHSHIKTTAKTMLATLKSALVSVACKKSTSEGEITGPAGGTETVTYTQCAAAGQACTSAGEPSGSIKTNLLDVSLFAQADSTVWMRYESSVPPYLDEFQCGVLKYRLKGTVAAVAGCNVNVMAKKDCETFAEGVGEQRLELEVVGGASEPTAETAAAKGKVAAKIEIKTL